MTQQSHHGHNTSHAPTDRTAHDHPTHDHGGHEGHEHGAMGGVNTMALSATLHCLTGCAIGEIAGLMIGTAIGLSTGWTIVLAISLAFLFGYTLSTLPLLKAGLGVGTALSVVLAADTLSIATMEVVDNAVMALIPGAMDAGLVNVVFWVAMMIALTAAFVAAYPVNRYLLQRGKGHALTHEYHGATGDVSGVRRFIPALATSTLVAAIVAFMLGGLVVSFAAELGVGQDTGSGGGAGGGHALSSVTSHR
jgi:preprotein translocase subunit SecG